MQPGRRRCYGSGPARKHCLVSLAVRGFILAVDVGWKRHVAEPLDLRGDATGGVRAESHGAQSKFSARGNLGFQFTFAKYDALPGFHLAARAHQRLPHVWSDLARQKDLHHAAQMLAALGTRRRIREHPQPAAEEARWYHARVVQNSEFVAVQQARQFGEHALRQLAGDAIHGQEARAVALLEWTLRDLRWRKLVVEFV